MIDDSAPGPRAVMWLQSLYLLLMMVGRWADATQLHLPQANQASIFPSLKGGITKLIHQSWKSHDLLPHHAAWQKTWRKNHRDWVFKLWIDYENHDLIRDSFPWLLETYDSMPFEIFRADIARYAYMFVYGGVYVDLDFESIKPLEDLLENTTIALAYDIRDDNGSDEVANAWLASAPGHPFWIQILMDIVERANDTSQWHTLDAIKQTGPGAVSRAYKRFSRVQRLPIFVAPPGIIYPYQKHEGGTSQDPCRYQGAKFDISACKAQNPDAVALTYWTGSWYRRSKKREGLSAGKLRWKPFWGRTNIMSTSNDEWLDQNSTA